jgi:voltage-dependent potassium channel beta subunit
VELSRAERIIRSAIDRGVNFIDISDIYAKGEAEKVVGAAIKGMTRSNLVISSKLFWPMSENVNDRGLSRKHIMESIEKSLRRIGTDYLDIYFCHRWDPETEVEEVVRAMDDLVHQGKVLYWGTSVWSAAQIELAASEGNKFHCYRPTVEQPRYNMLDRHVESEIIPTCERLGMGLTVWSPLAQGLLTGKYNNGMPSESRGATTNWLKNDLTKENIEKVGRLAALASELGISVGQMALAWILRLPQISCVLTGATDSGQVEENMKATEIRLDGATLRQIEVILADNLHP